MNKENREAINWSEIHKVLGLNQNIWNKRLLAMYGFIDERDHVVVDVGAGNMYLRRLLSPETKYYPIDYVSRCDDTIVSDLNAHEFPEIQGDVAFCAGILEYIKDSDWLIETLCSRFRKVIISYRGREKFTDQQLYTSEIIDKFGSLGYAMTGRNYDYDWNWTLIACFEKITPETLNRNMSCTGCGACANSCLHEAIIMRYDEKGFLKPTIDKESCKGCMKCLSVCPTIEHKDNINNQTPVCYAAWAEDDIRRNSSSGGAFSVIAKAFITKGGHVFGVKWNQEFTPVYTEITDVKDLPEINHSKYAQSETGDSFKKVKELIQNQELVCYAGCPCQIAGLKSYLGNLAKSDFLYTIDLVCFCAPSNQMFHKYLEENWGIDNVNQVTFRDKRNGWSPTGYRIDLKNGETLYPEIGDDMYQTAFHNVMVRNKTCEHCRFAKFPRVGDLTLGDFWGVTVHDSGWSDQKGTSMILVNNPKADSFLEHILLCFKRIEKVPLEWALNKGNVVNGVERPSHRNADYLSKLIKKTDFNTAVHKAYFNQHDVGLVVMLNRNIGNNLTNYALYRVLNDLDYTVLMIGQPADSTLSCDNRIEGLFLQCPYPKEDYLPGPIDYFDMPDLNRICERFVLGSDQVLRTSIAAGNRFHACMDWVNDSKTKIAYSSSLGLDYFDGSDEDAKRIGYYLSRFDAISIRESSGVALLKNHFDLDAEWVLDPVFLCDKQYFEQMVKMGQMRVPEESYTCAYILDPSPERAEFIDNTAAFFTSGKARSILEEGTYEKLLFDWNIDTLQGPTNEEFISHIFNCDFFVTDSFHGICFAILFNKQFIVVHNVWQWRGFTRIVSILNLLGLQERLVGSWQEVLDKELLHKRIDYSKVKRILEENREKSIQWLQAALKINKESQTFSAHDSYQHDLCSLHQSSRQQITDLTKRMEQLECELNGLKSTMPFRVMNKLYPVKQKIQRKQHLNSEE